jgi:hypothetical protein
VIPLRKASLILLQNPNIGLRTKRLGVRITVRTHFRRSKKRNARPADNVL